MSVFVLASSAGEKTLWDPTILGVLVVLSAVGLFCGSVYLLLATNLGARLGFLVGPPAIGFVSQLTSLTTGLGLVVLLMALIVPLSHAAAHADMDAQDTR